MPPMKRRLEGSTRESLLEDSRRELCEDERLWLLFLFISVNYKSDSQILFKRAGLRNTDKKQSKQTKKNKT